MAIINHTHKFIFVHVPKAAGTSISKALSGFTTYKDLELGGTHFGELIQRPYLKRFGISKHSPASKIKSLVGDDIWGEYYTFCFVRNPYERVVSTFFFLKGWNGCPSPLQKKLLGFENINEYVLSNIWKETYGPDDIFRPQVFWLTDVEDKNKLLVDNIYKLENIDSDMKSVLKRISGVERGLEVPFLNKSEKSSEELNLSAEAIHKINEFYKRDFEILKYEMKK